MIISTTGDSAAAAKLTTAEILSRLGADAPGDVPCPCPGHDDRQASLSIGVGDDGRVLVHCHAGCSTEDVVEAVGLSIADLFPGEAKKNRSTTKRPKAAPAKPDSGAPAPKKNGRRRKPTKVYHYRDADGKLVYQVLRYDSPKDFRQRRMSSDSQPGGKWRWVYSLRGVPRLLYRLPELAGAPKSKIVFFVEGEKDADRLASLGLVTTTNSGGAAKWEARFADDLAGRRVVILPDNDDAGRSHAQRIAQSITKKAKAVKILELPGLPEKGDVSDWIDAGGTVDELRRLCEEAPEWWPTGDDDSEISSDSDCDSDKRITGASTKRTVESKITYERITSAELADATFDTNWLVEWTLVEGQPCILAGGKKTLKTSIAIDLGISLATALPFLGKLEVPEARNVMIMSGESGLSTIQETARRVAWAKGCDLRDIGNLTWSSNLPQFGDERHHVALKDFLVDDAVEVLVIDPAYLCMPGGDAGNLFVQGDMLRAMGDLCGECGVTMILLHHARKHVANPNSPPELEDIAWSGFQEFARQWLLVGRRSPYKPGTGAHRLWLNVGGSAGHSNLWGVDVDEGQLPFRTWTLSLLRSDEIRSEISKQKSDEKRQHREQQIDDDTREVVRALTTIGEPATKTRIRDHTALSSPRVAAAIARLLGDKTISEATVGRENGHTYEGYELVESEGQL